MALSLISTLITFFCFLRYTSGYNTDDQVGANVDYGSFEDPSAYVRPRFRYWIPDASVNLSIVAEDFSSAKEVGMGGMELLGYYLYGNYPGVSPIPVDWTKYGWGTQAWKELMTVALRAAKSNGLIMDFSNGPNQGAGVPAKPDEEGLMWELWPYNVSVAIGGTFDGILPGWGSGKFISASTALVTASRNSTFSALPDWVGPYFYNGTSQTLAADSLEDVTDKVGSDGHLSLSFPSGSKGLHYQVFAFYQNHSTYLEQASPLVLNSSGLQSPVESFVENGSWVVDHFSSTGAQIIIDFWEKYLLDDATRQLIQEVGNYGWEDSMEFGAGTLVWWTSQLLDAFQAGRGYPLNKYLPLIYTYNTEADGPLASPDHFITDEADGGYSYVNDYWQTLTELNRIYLQTLSNWTATSLQSQFSAQVVYNLPMDMLANIPSVNAPECESLGFNHLIDGYRQFTGPANLAGKRVISSELGAQRNEVYSQTLPELIWDTKRSIVGSVNQFVYHGYPFSGNYPNTTWPGFTTFSYEFSNMHGPRQPSWEHYKDYMDWTGRMQFVAQSGIPKIDLAFWLKRDQYFGVPAAYEPNDLAETGYSYEYLSPDNFDLPDAYVENSILAPNRQAFKALIIRQNDTLTVAGIQHLVNFAHAGLPIVFSGGLPQNLTGYSASGTDYVRSALARLVSLDNVHVVPYANLAASLGALDITPRTSVNADQIMYTYWREDTNASTSYVILYNDAWAFEIGQGTATGSITFATTGVPYIYDAWTGAVDAVVAYQQTNLSTTIPFTLAGNESAIIAFRHNETANENIRLISSPDTVFSVSSTNGGSLSIRAATSSEPALVANGTAISLPTSADAVTLTNWTLTIESWASPSDPSSDQTAAVKSNSTHQLTTLKPWNQISPALQHVSGRGFYRSNFTWPPADGQADGAMIDLGVIVQTARVWVNGQEVPALDPTNAVADIGDYLRQGENRVEIVVTTTLGNAMIPIYKDLKTSGLPWLGPKPVAQEYGLVRPVTIVPYRVTTISA